MNPYLSILIPTRNRSKYVSSAISSALAVSGQVEILISENYGDDDGWDVCNSFEDTRIKLFRPPNPLPMHEHFDFLLKKSKGEWVTFIGDDDAILPYAADYIEKISRIYPSFEAIASPRAYYFWPQSDDLFGNYRAPFSKEIQIHDSKLNLELTLNGQIDYMFQPQLYSGGFQRRSLIQRVIASQNGRYFKTTQPDVFSALMGLLFTSRYLRVGLPLSIVGTSPSSTNGHTRIGKDREKDFFDLLNKDTFGVHPIYNTSLVSSSLAFYETYISAAPLTNLYDDNLKRLEKIYLRAYSDYLNNNNIEMALRLSKHLNIPEPSQDTINSYLLLFPKITPDPILGSQWYGVLPETSNSKSILDAVQFFDKVAKQVFSYDTFNESI